ncbi:MAG: hypothetical protein LBF04_00685 [Prevotellaceae bacterium]|jgi:hypothetical protein|nr:hypothetical protein [Prevotellaceae bacterium]
MKNQEIQLEIIDDKVKVTTPYHSTFVARARNLRGTWKNGAWWFDDSLLDYVREVLIEYFGTTGETSYETCTLLIKNFNDDCYTGPVTLFGRTVARAWGRDSGAKLGDDIVFLSGIYKSGGSVKNWRTEVENATFELHNFPVPSLELPAVKAAVEAGWCEVKQAKKKRSKEEIQADINVCKARLQELETELNN